MIQSNLIIRLLMLRIDTAQTVVRDNFTFAIAFCLINGFENQYPLICIGYVERL